MVPIFVLLSVEGLWFNFTRTVRGLIGAFRGRWVYAADHAYHLLSPFLFRRWETISIAPIPLRSSVIAMQALPSLTKVSVTQTKLNTCLQLCDYP